MSETSKGPAAGPGTAGTAQEGPKGLFIGFDQASAAQQALSLEPETLLRHMMAIGSSGSGKTVVCKNLVEEFVRHGVPAICLDPQGDLCSLALAADDPELLQKKGVDPRLAAAFNEQADVVVFTPASRKGIGLSVDPIQTDILDLPPHDRIHAVTATATMLVSLLGYDLDSDDAEGLIAVFDRVLTERLDAGRYPDSLDTFSQYLMGMEPERREAYTRYLDSGKIDQALRKLARLDVGARRMLFHEGLPLSIELLLGLGENSAAIPGKTRVSVIYLNTLHSQEDKEFFVAAIVEQLYRWMLRNPSEAPQALFYIDEIAPYIPPVRKPASKPALGLLFKQARKYGISCLTATQNPGDVDYKAMAQFGSWAIGRLTTRQDMKKVQPTVKSLDPVHVDDIMSTLPSLKPGRFVLISPDNFDQSRQLKARWLYTRHRTLDEEEIQQLADERWRTRFDALHAATPASIPAHDTAARDHEPPSPGATETGAEPDPLAPDIPLVGAQPNHDGLPEELTRAHSVLSRYPSLTTREFSRRLKQSESRARALLSDLLEHDLAERYRDGRSYHYWSRSSGYRPDLGLRDDVHALVPRLQEQEAIAAGYRLRNQRLFGLFGAEEEISGIRQEYRLLIKLSFQEKVRQPLWKRLVSFRSHEQRLESVYLHPRTLQFIRYQSGEGITLEDRPEEHASHIADFDGVTRIEKRLPGDMIFDPHEFPARPEDAVIIAHFQQVYPARVKKLEQLFMPVWRVLLKQSNQPGERIVLIDAFEGNLVEW